MMKIIIKVILIKREKIVSKYAFRTVIEAKNKLQKDSLRLTFRSLLRVNQTSKKII